MNNYYVSFLPGMAAVVAEEIQSSTGLKARGPSRMRNAELLFLRGDGPRSIMQLRTIEDVYVQLGDVALSGRPDDLATLSKSKLFGAGMQRALGLWSTVSGKTSSNRVVFRVVVQADDVQWRQYRRVDLQKAAEVALSRAQSSWRLSPSEAPLEIWMQQIDRKLLIGLRLTTGVDRQHGGRMAEREAALRPSVAAAMVRLSNPEPTDVFLDPMCGAGTILLERATTARYSMLLGGDIDKSAVAVTLANFGPRHKPRQIEKWDATSLPLEDDSVNKLVCNLPWGRQVGEKSALPRLYRDFLKEAVRVLVSGGCMVLLTSEWDMLKQAMKMRPELKLERTVKAVEVLGRRADIFVIEKVVSKDYHA